jgi:hypothetical protein
MKKDIIYKAILFAVSSMRAHIILVFGAIMVLSMLFYLISSLIYVFCLACAFFGYDFFTLAGIIFVSLATYGLFWLLCWLNYMSLESLKDSSVQTDLFHIGPRHVACYTFGFVMYHIVSVVSFMAFFIPGYIYSYRSYFVPTISFVKACPQNLHKQSASLMSHAPRYVKNVCSIVTLSTILSALAGYYATYYYEGIFIIPCIALYMLGVLFFNTYIFHELHDR